MLKIYKDNLKRCPFCGGFPKLCFSGPKYLAENGEVWKGYIIVKCINFGGAGKGSFYHGPSIDIPLEETLGGEEAMQCWNLRVQQSEGDV